jgi:hypothetical protein
MLRRNSRIVGPFRSWTASVGRNIPISPTTDHPVSVWPGLGNFQLVKSPGFANDAAKRIDFEA